MQVSFFRQFGISVTKEDYNCLRLGFIAVRMGADTRTHTIPLVYIHSTFPTCAVTLFFIMKNGVCPLDMSKPFSLDKL